MTVEEMLHRMSASEFTEWQAFYAWQREQEKKRGSRGS